MWISALVLVIALIMFKRLRTAVWIGIFVIAGIMLVGMTEDPGIVWALLFAGVIFFAIVFFAVKLLADSAKTQNDMSDQAAAHLRTVMGEQKRTRLFGKFKSRV